MHQWNYSDADDGAVVATLTDDGVMSIQGSGWCDPPGTNNFWMGWNQLGYNDTIKEVVYGEGIMDTGPGAFGGCPNITRITLPSTLKEIERYAFNNTDIEEINIPDSVKIAGGLKEIGYQAFARCVNLEGITLPEGLQEIGSLAFSECYKLTDIIIPKSVTEHLNTYQVHLGCIVDRTR